MNYQNWQIDLRILRVTIPALSPLCQGGRNPHDLIAEIVNYPNWQIDLRILTVTIFLLYGPWAEPS